MKIIAGDVSFEAHFEKCLFQGQRVFKGVAYCYDKKRCKLWTQTTDFHSLTSQAAIESAEDMLLNDILPTNNIKTYRTIAGW